jgi:hypothetical protein
VVGHSGGNEIKGCLERMRLCALRTVRRAGSCRSMSVSKLMGFVPSEMVEIFKV